MQYDGDKTHGTEECLSYLESKGIKTLALWPPRSPDLSPIENLWAIVQKRVDTHGPSDEEELWEFVKEVWYGIPMKEVRALVSSFPRRCKKCIELGGKTITTRTKANEREE